MFPFFHQTNKLLIKFSLFYKVAILVFIYLFLIAILKGVFNLYNIKWSRVNWYLWFSNRVLNSIYSNKLNWAVYYFKWKWLALPKRKLIADSQNMSEMSVEIWLEGSGLVVYIFQFEGKSGKTRDAFYKFWWQVFFFSEWFDLDETWKNGTIY